ncbi:MAG: glycosyltransferase [Candidatus Geothermincolia bacterium]
MPRVTIVILNYNGADDTVGCLSSLESLDCDDCEITVVDNASEDGSVQAVRDGFPGVRVIENPCNLGFAAGCNAGLEDALDRGADYVLLLNNDTESIDPSFLRKLVDFAEGIPEAGAVSPVILYHDSDVVWFAGGRVSYLTGFSRHIGKGRPSSGLTAGRPYAVDYVSGCAMLLSAKFLREVGLFDEDYFFYYEDTDLCARGKAAGYPSYVVPESTFSHKKSASAGVEGENKLTPFQAYYMAASAIVFARKNLAGWRRAAFLAAQFTVRLAYNTLNVTSLNALGRYLAGLRDGLLGRPVGVVGSVRTMARLYGRAFTLLERFGVHVTPVNYYFPVPDTRALDDDLWAADSAMPGVDMREEGQLELLAEFSTGFKDEYESLPREQCAKNEYVLNNRFFGPVDGEVSYCMIRRFRPRKIVEVGSGFSTLLAAGTILRNAAEGAACELTAIEPYPNDVLIEGFDGLTRLLRQPIEQVPLEEFEALGENDILFIDSSHVLRFGGDVQHEYLEILPRLRPGVIVHVHDIFLPSHYPREWVMGRQRFWTEQYVLQAFLAFNDSFEVLMANAFLAAKRPGELSSAFNSFAEGVTFPASFWMRRT